MRKIWLIFEINSADLVVLKIISTYSRDSLLRRAFFIVYFPLTRNVIVTLTNFLKRFNNSFSQNSTSSLKRKKFLIFSENSEVYHCKTNSRKQINRFFLICAAFLTLVTSLIHFRNRCTFLKYVFFLACSMNSSVNINLLSYIKSKKFIFDVIQQSARDSDIDRAINWDCFCCCDEFERLIVEFVVFITVAAITLCWIISDIIFRMIAWIISWIFLFESFFWCWSVVSVSLKKEKIMNWENFL